MKKNSFFSDSLSALANRVVPETGTQKTSGGSSAEPIVASLTQQEKNLKTILSQLSQNSQQVEEIYRGMRELKKRQATDVSAFNRIMAFFQEYVAELKTELDMRKPEATQEMNRQMEITHVKFMALAEKLGDLEVEAKAKDGHFRNLRGAYERAFEDRVERTPTERVCEELVTVYEDRLNFYIDRFVDGLFRQAINEYADYIGFLEDLVFRSYNFSEDFVKSRKAERSKLKM